MLDLLAGADTERTRLRDGARRSRCRSRPSRSAGPAIEATRRSLARADANGGKENLWLKAMERLGLGFDS